MNTAVADILKARIQHLAFVDRLAGLVKTLSGTTEGESGNKRFLIPIACDVSEADCANGRYQDLVPDSSKRSVIYFEDIGGVQGLPDEGGMMRFRANLKLVGWLNLSRMGLTDCNYSATAALAIIKALKQTSKYKNEGNFLHFNITAISEQEKISAIFGKYTYQENIVQYLLYPYDYFALNISVEFSVNPNCIENPEIPDIPLCDDDNGTVNPPTPSNGQCWDLLRWDCDKNMWVRWHPQTGEGDFSIHVADDGSLSFVPAAQGGGINCDELAECQVIQDIQADIIQLNSDLGEEIGLREQGDIALHQEIDDEIQAREDADTDLQQQIDAEEAARISGDQTNDSNLSTHIANTNNPHNTTAAQVAVPAYGMLSGLNVEAQLQELNNFWLPSRFWYLYSDLEGTNASNTTLNSDRINFGFGVTGSATPVASEAGHFGIISLGTGNNAAGASYIGTSAGLYLGNGEVMLQYCVRFPVLSTVAQTFEARIGGIGLVSGNSADGVFFRYTDGVNSGNWQFVTRQGNVESVINTSIPVTANTWYRLTAMVNAAGAIATGYINGTNIGSLSTNIPTVNSIALGAQINKTVGTTARIMQIDWLMGYWKPANQRL